MPRSTVWGSVRRFALTGAVLLACGSAVAVMGPASAATAVTVSINAAQARATIPSVGVGMNVAVWDSQMDDALTSTLLHGAGVQMVRYPGGSYADIYHWQTHTAENGGYIAANTEFDPFVAMVHAAGAQPIITANYGTGTAQEAADWVRYANVTKGYGIKYWEIGNEVYGNGLYGATWEADNHSSKTATTYATNLVQYANAMKAVDPTIKIGAVLTTPGGWPDGIVGPGDTMDWNHTVMSIAGSKIDFVIVHQYPSVTSEADLLSKPQTEPPAVMSTLHSLINQYAGSNAANVGVAVTEFSSQFAMDTSPTGLYAPDIYLDWMENGAFNMDWWNLRNGTDCSHITTIQGATDYGDSSIVSTGASCEPPVNTPFPVYYGMQMIGKLGSPGDALVQASASSSLLSAHAVKRANGDLNVMLINKDPNNDATVNLSYSGFTPSPATPTVSSYLKNATSIGSAPTGTGTTQTVPAYSIVVVQLHPGTGSSPSASPSVSASPSPGGGTGACRVAYAKTSEWAGGMVANVTITNTGAAAINAWRLTFAFPGDTKVGNAWNADVTQNGAAVTATNASYNGVITAGGSQSFGFTGSWSSNNASPTSFTLNGSSCATG
jgi:hypothetical protein